MARKRQITSETRKASRVRTLTRKDDRKAKSFARGAGQ